MAADGRRKLLAVFRISSSFLYPRSSAKSAVPFLLHYPIASLDWSYPHSCSSCHSWFLVRNGRKINHESHERHESGRPNVGRSFTKTKPMRSWAHVLEVDPDWSYLHSCSSCHSWFLVRNGRRINHESHERHESGRPNVWRSFTKTKPMRSWPRSEVDPDWSYLHSCSSCHSWFLVRSIVPVVPEATNPCAHLRNPRFLSSSITQ